MSKELQAALSLVQKLKPIEQLTLLEEVSKLVREKAEIEWDNSWIDEELLVEIKKRSKQIKEGKVKTIPGEEVMAQLRKKLDE